MNDRNHPAILATLPVENSKGILTSESTLEVFSLLLLDTPYNNKGEEEFSGREEAGRKRERPASLLRPCSQSANCHRCAKFERAKVCDQGAWKENEERARPLPHGAAPKEGRGSLHHDMPHKQRQPPMPVEGCPNAVTVSIKEKRNAQHGDTRSTPNRQHP